MQDDPFARICDYVCQLISSLSKLTSSDEVNGQIRDLLQSLTTQIDSSLLSALPEPCKQSFYYYEAVSWQLNQTFMKDPKIFSNLSKACISISQTYIAFTKVIALIFFQCEFESWSKENQAQANLIKTNVWEGVRDIFNEDLKGDNHTGKPLYYALLKFTGAKKIQACDDEKEKQKSGEDSFYDRQTLILVHYFLYVDELVGLEQIVELSKELSFPLEHHYESVAMMMAGPLSPREILIDRLVSEALKLLSQASPLSIKVILTNFLCLKGHPVS